MSPVVPLPIVDGWTLPSPHRELLRPGELLPDRNGELHRLPRFFYIVASNDVALGTLLTPHFGLWEFMEVDLYEATALRRYPRYIPCAVTLLAAALEVLRTEVGASIRVAANGGYRSPSHAGSASGSPHCWGVAANVYRIGTEYIDTEDKILRYSALAARTLAGCWTRPYGVDRGYADDHLHVDLGYVTAVPRASSETAGA